MAKRTLTAANAVLMISVTSLFNTPRQIQGFAADDVFDFDAIDTAEAPMGVDGILSAGLVINAIKQGITVQGDSESADLFDTWYASQRAVGDVYWADGSIVLPGLGKKYIMSNGVLQNFKPVSDAKKILQSRKFNLVWESITVANV